MVLGWEGDIVLARDRALEAGNGVKIRYVIPREGGLIGNDVLAIPADSPHPKNAEKWLNYLMRPNVIADFTNAVKYPNGNRASLPFVQDAIKNDPALYPDAETRAKLHTLKPMPPDFARLVTRLWTQISHRPMTKRLTGGNVAHTAVGFRVADIGGGRQRVDSGDTSQFVSSRPTPAGGHSEMIATNRPLGACGTLISQRSRSLCDSLVDDATRLEYLCQHSVSLQRYWMIAVAFYACA